MRVLHLIPSLGAGGAERQLAYLCEGLAASGCAVEVGILSGGPNRERIERAGVPIHHLPVSHRDPRLFFSLVVYLGTSIFLHMSYIR